MSIPTVWFAWTWVGIALNVPQTPQEILEEQEILMLLVSKEAIIRRGLVWVKGCAACVVLLVVGGGTLLHNLSPTC